MSLFQTSLIGLSDYVRVEHSQEFMRVFDYLFSLQHDVLYNHSQIFPFSYLNKGNMQLYLNKDYSENKVIPVVKKFKEKPHFNLFTPHADLDEILKVVTHLDRISSEPVEIIDVDGAYAEHFISQARGWKKVKTSDDIVQDVTALAELKGRGFSSLRNTLKHVRVDLQPQIMPLSTATVDDAVRVFTEWKERQGLKYFRVTVGRDIRLVQEYADKVCNFKDMFSCIYFVNEKPVACNFGCRSVKDPEWGIDVTVKANIEYKGMGDFAFCHLMRMMHENGIKYVNDSGGTGKVKLNKLKFAPLKSIPMYNLVRE